MTDEQKIKLLKELVNLLYSEVEALSDSDYQEEYDCIFTSAMQARKEEIEKLLWGFVTV